MRYWLATTIGGHTIQYYQAVRSRMAFTSAKRKLNHRALCFDCVLSNTLSPIGGHLPCPSIAPGPPNKCLYIRPYIQLRFVAISISLTWPTMLLCPQKLYLRRNYNTNCLVVVVIQSRTTSGSIQIIALYFLAVE